MAQDETDVGFTAQGRGGAMLAVRIGDVVLFDAKVGPQGSVSEYLTPGNITLRAFADFYQTGREA